MDVLRLDRKVVSPEEGTTQPGSSATELGKGGCYLRLRALGLCRSSGLCQHGGPHPAPHLCPGPNPAPGRSLACTPPPLLRGPPGRRWSVASLGPGPWLRSRGGASPAGQSGPSGTGWAKADKGRLAPIPGCDWRRLWSSAVPCATRTHRGAGTHRLGCPRPHSPRDQARRALRGAHAPAGAALGADSRLARPPAPSVPAPSSPDQPRGQQVRTTPGLPLHPALAQHQTLLQRGPWTPPSAQKVSRSRVLCQTQSRRGPTLGTESEPILSCRGLSTRLSAPSKSRTVAWGALL